MRSYLFTVLLLASSTTFCSAELDFFVNRTLWPAADAAEQQRVVLVTNSYDRNIDGVALTLNRLVAHLMRHGHEVLIIVPKPGPRQQIPVLRTAGAPVVHVPSLAFPLWSEYRLTWKLGREARRRLTAFMPTVMHIAIQDGLGHAAQRWATSHNVPVVCSHHTRFERYLGYYKPLRPFACRLEAAYWWGMRRFHGQCAATLPPSLSLARDLEAHGVPRVGVWHRGVDRSLFNPSTRSEAWRAGVGDGDEETPIVLIVARLRWEKGLRAFASVVSDLGTRHVHVRVAVVGDGPAREDFESLLPPTASFFGTLTGPALATAYASSDIFLYPSTTEGWGATCLEAQAAGIPVVATASSGIVEVIKDGVGGMLLPPHNVSALTDAVASLVADPKLRRGMGRRAAEHAAAFDWEHSGDRMLCEYQTHTRGRAKPMASRTGAESVPGAAENGTAASYCHN